MTLRIMKEGKDLKNKERLAWIFRKDVTALHCQSRKINPLVFQLYLGIFFTKKCGTFPMSTQRPYREQVYKLPKTNCYKSRSMTVSWLSDITSGE